MPGPEVCKKLVRGIKKEKTDRQVPQPVISSGSAELNLRSSRYWVAGTIKPARNTRLATSLGRPRVLKQNSGVQCSVLVVSSFDS